jgi:ATP-dependent exoDNAse (exonuclease V) beta subunit
MLFLANNYNQSLYVAVTRARKQLWFMETQENSVDPIIQTLSLSNNLELAEVVKQKDDNASNLLIQLTHILIFAGCSKGHGSAGRWFGRPRKVAQESSTSSPSEELCRGKIVFANRGRASC